MHSHSLEAKTEIVTVFNRFMSTGPGITRLWHSLIEILTSKLLYSRFQICDENETNERPWKSPHERGADRRPPYNFTSVEPFITVIIPVHHNGEGTATTEESVAFAR
jgi:hypothetical protein